MSKIFCKSKKIFLFGQLFCLKIIDEFANAKYLLLWNAFC